MDYNSKVGNKYCGLCRARKNAVCEAEGNTIEVLARECLRCDRPQPVYREDDEQ